MLIHLSRRVLRILEPKRLLISEGRLQLFKLAYKLYQKKLSGPRWEALVKKGAKKQRLLWASTSVKNPAYPDTLYVASLIGPDTVARLLYTNSRVAILALAANSIHKLWKWQRSALIATLWGSPLHLSCLTYAGFKWGFND